MTEKVILEEVLLFKLYYRNEPEGRELKLGRVSVTALRHSLLHLDGPDLGVFWAPAALLGLHLHPVLHDPVFLAPTRNQTNQTQG